FSRASNRSRSCFGYAIDLSPSNGVAEHLKLHVKPPKTQLFCQPDEAHTTFKRPDCQAARHYLTY
ncbi:MAG: hypothetical protein VW950_00705, partial [Rhodobiaceae bacterium]